MNVGFSRRAGQVFRFAAFGLALFGLGSVGIGTAAASVTQQNPPPKAGEKPAEAPKDAQKPDKPEDKKDGKTSDKPLDPKAVDQTPKAEKPKKLGKPETWDGETLAEVVIFAYGSRPVIEYVCTNAREEGFIRIANGEDRPPIEGKFKQFFLRRESSDRDNVRIEVELPDPQGGEPQELAFGFNGFTNWATQNRKPIALTQQAEASFKASLVNDYMSLLRFREDGSKVEKVGAEKITGIDTFVLELTRRDGSKTRYYVSSKTYRVLHLEYELTDPGAEKPVKFRESFYEFRAVQNVLVPMRKVLYEDGKFKQEIELREIRYRLAKLDEDVFLRY